MHTNTGFLGVTVRGILRASLRNNLRRYMLAKIDVSHNGSTTVRIRHKANARDPMPEQEKSQ
jgi:hypothetical protein